jgi:hypothetical protein
MTSAVSAGVGQMMTRKRIGSVTGAIFVLLASVALPGMAAAQDGSSVAASASDDAYRYIDDADTLLDAMGTSPPDHGFRFDGIDCWAWAMADGSTILAEPLGDDYRYYVFAPGDNYPFFVGDKTYAYGFEGRTLAAVYGDNGDLVDPSDDIVDGAAWLSDRGFGMKRAMQTPEPVYAGDWADSIGWFGAIELRLDTWRNRPGWVRYRAGPGRWHHRDWREKLGVEGQKRRQRAEWFDRWRRDGYRGPPQDGGKWVTKPDGGQPGKDIGPGNRPGRGHWIGRPRPVAPPTPGTPGATPGWPGRGDGAGPGRRPYPPRFGRPVPGSPMPTAPAAPVISPPPVVAPTPSASGVKPGWPGRGDNAGPGRRPYPPRFDRPIPAEPMPAAPTAPETSPTPPVAVSPAPDGDRGGHPMRWPRIQRDGDRPSVVAPPAAPAPAPTPGAMRGGGRFERPVRIAPQPPMVKIDRGGATDSVPPEVRAVSPRPEPRRMPPPVSVAPRPSFTPPRAPVSAPPSPPPSPPSPPAARVAPAPPAARPGGLASGPRNVGSPRGDGGNRPGGKGRDK